MTHHPRPTARSTANAPEDTAPSSPRRHGRRSRIAPTAFLPLCLVLLLAPASMQPPESSPPSSPHHSRQHLSLMHSSADRLGSAVGSGGITVARAQCDVFDSSRTTREVQDMLVPACDADVNRSSDTCLCKVSKNVIINGGVDWNDCSNAQQELYEKMGAGSIDAPLYKISEQGGANTQTGLESTKAGECFPDDTTAPAVFNPLSVGSSSIEEYCEALAQSMPSTLDKMYVEAGKNLMAGRQPMRSPRGCVPGCIVGNLVPAQFARSGFFGIWNGKCFLEGESKGGRDALGDPPNVWNYANPGPLWILPGRYNTSDVSWFDSRPTIGLDYITNKFWISLTQAITRNSVPDYTIFHDEMREVKPGMFLGQIFIPPRTDTAFQTWWSGWLWDLIDQGAGWWYKLLKTLRITSVWSDECYGGESYTCPRGDLRDSESMNFIGRSSNPNAMTIPVRFMQFALFQTQDGLDESCFEYCDGNKV